MNSKVFNLPPLLMKIGQKCHLLKIMEEGEVYFGTYKGYRVQEQIEYQEIKDKILKGQQVVSDDFDLIKRDSLEGLEERLNGKLNVRFTSKGNKVDIQGIDAKLNLFQNDYTHLYCMFGFPQKIPIDFNFDKRLSRFGDHVLLFNSKVFLTALADILHSGFDFNYVNYYTDNEVKLKLGAYTKRELFSYQYEYRVVANLTSNKVNIGDALAKSKDTLLLKFEDLNKLEFDYML